MLQAVSGGHQYLRKPCESRMISGRICHRPAESPVSGQKRLADTSDYRQWKGGWDFQPCKSQDRSCLFSSEVVSSLTLSHNFSDSMGQPHGMQPSGMRYTAPCHLESVLSSELPPMPPTKRHSTKGHFRIQPKLQGHRR